MLLQGALLIPTFSTLTALKRFLSSVDTLVDHKVGRAEKGSSAVRKVTGVRSLSLMMSFVVINQATFRTKGSRTVVDRTSKLFAFIAFQVDGKLCGKGGFVRGRHREQNG